MFDIRLVTISFALGRTEGQTMTEYAMIGGAIAAVCAAVLVLMGTEVETLYQEVVAAFELVP